MQLLDKVKVITVHIFLYFFLLTLMENTSHHSFIDVILLVELLYVGRN